MSLGHSVMNTDQIAGDEGRSEEAWVIGANPELAIRARNVSMYLERGGSLKEVRLTESEHGDWSVWLRLAAPGCAWPGAPENTGSLNSSPMPPSSIATSAWRSPPAAMISATSARSSYRPTAIRLTRPRRTSASPRSCTHKAEGVRDEPAWREDRQADGGNALDG
jgi:hypothetical protein